MPKDHRYDDEDIDMKELDNDVDNPAKNVDADSNNNDNTGDLGITHPKNISKKNVANSKRSLKSKTRGLDSEVNLSSDDINGDGKGNPSDSSSENVLDENDDDSKFFVVRVAGGQENMIASMLQTRLNTKKIEGIYSVLFLDSFKGYVIVEAIDSNIAYEALHGIRHIRGQIRGELPFKDLEGYLVKKPVVTELTIEDTVEIIAGPFKSMKAKITRVDYEKQEATVVLLDSPYQIPVTVDANYLKKSL